MGQIGFEVGDWERKQVVETRLNRKKRGLSFLFRFSLKISGDASTCKKGTELFAVASELCSSALKYK